MARPRNARASHATAKKAPATRPALKEKTTRPALKEETPRPALKEKTTNTRAKAPVYPDDGDTERLLKDAKPKRGRPAKPPQNEDELLMAGGLGTASDSEAPLTTEELANDGSAPAPPLTTNRRPPRTARKIARNEASTTVLQGLKKRMEAAANGRRAKPPVAAAIASETAATSSDPLPVKAALRKSANAVTERSEPSLTPSPPPPGKLGAVKGPRTVVVQPGSVMKTHNTSLVESSIIALKNFKRRPRQGSMLQMLQQRTASARLSLANSVANTLGDNAVDDSSQFELDLGASDEEDDFAPEAEGTPLNAGKVVRQSAGSARDTTLGPLKAQQTAMISTARKRRSDQGDISSAPLRALRAKRQKWTPERAEGQREPDEPTARDQAEQDAIRPSPERPETPQPALTSDVQVINSPPTSTPPTDPPSSRNHRLMKGDSFVVPSTEHEVDVPGSDAELEENDGPNDITADPLSSSPVPARELDEDVTRAPATQASPEPVKRKPRARPKPLNTAILQSLLPKRRRALNRRDRKSGYDFGESDDDPDAPLEVSHSDDDEDELGGRLRKAPRPVSSKWKKKAPPVAKSSKAPAAQQAPSRTAKKAPKTYGRRGEQSDKENDAGSDFEEADESTLPEISVSMQEVAHSKELEAAKAKFADVDTWNMDFESMSAEDHRSSSQGWR